MQQQPGSESNLTKRVKACSLCNGIYDPVIAFCPKDGNKLSESLVDTERIILEVRQTSEMPIDANSNVATTSRLGGDTVVTGAPDNFLDGRKDYDPAALIGRIIDGKYRIESILGSGGMSIVYKAWEIFLNKYVALKMLRPHMMAMPTSLQRFQQEARAASNLNHPNVISVYSFGAPDGNAYLAMDYLDGWSLSDLVGEGKSIGVDRAVPIFVQIADALSHAHGRGVIHRDLKPSNVILVNHDGQDDFVKLVDFGIAKLLNQEGLDGMRLTQTGEIFGSPLYMSPEQSRGELMDARSDVYPPWAA